MYLNVTGATPAAGLSGLRLVRLPTIITPRGVVRGMGVLMLRSRGFRGLGVDVSSFTGSQLAAQDLLSYTSTLGSQVEAGTAPTPAQMAAAVEGDVSAYCAQWPARCAGGPPDLSSVEAQYAQQYGQQVQRVQQGAQQGTIALPLPASYYAGASPAAAAPPPGQPLNAQIENLSGGSPSSFKVGDQWRLTISGPANSQVTGSSNHNGQSNPSAPFGSTNASGVLVLTGSMSADTVGNWSEQWNVGGQQAGTVSFTVAAPAAAPAPAPSSSSPAAAPAPAPSNASPAPVPSAAPANGFDLSSLTSSLSNQVSIAGFSFPLFGWLAVGGVALYAVTRGKGK